MSARFSALLRLGCVVIGWAVLGAALPQGALALTPEERLDHPALEERARKLSAQLRCLVCQNQSIDDSDASIAKDLRTNIRHQLLTGSSDQQILDTLREKYGDFILLDPPFGWHTLLLWLTPLIIVLLGGGVLWGNWRSDQTAPAAPASTGDPNDPSHDYTPISPTMPLLVGAMLVTMVLGSGGVYLLLGNPTLPDQPIEARQKEIFDAARQTSQRQQQQQQRLEQALSFAQLNRDEISAWFDVAVAANNAENIKLELEAISQLQRLEPDNPQWWVNEADALSRLADGQITTPARRLLQKAIDRDPTLIQAQYFLGIADYQDQRFPQAMARWQKLLHNPLLARPWRKIIENSVIQTAELAELPLPEWPRLDDSPARSPVMDDDVKAMVERLAARLSTEPDDLHGWYQLARSYEVLGQPVGMIKALIETARLQPENLEAQLVPLEQMLFNELTPDFGTEALLLLESIKTIAPDHPRYLFFAGHLAHLRGDAERARQHWQRLLEILPADTPETAVLKKHIEQLDTAKENS